MSLYKKNILITGGAGTLGRAIIQRSIDHDWGSHITIFSTDTLKHHAVQKQFPHVRAIVGDVRDPKTVSNAVAGHNVVIHAAAVKHIPDSEWNSLDTQEINVDGSINVIEASIHHRVEQVIGISTDKACHPANAYGATKYLMEKIFQEYARLPIEDIKFNLVRYGNVLESTASVLEVWQKAYQAGEALRITDPSMTRFWLSPKYAANLVQLCAELKSGEILIPKLKALSIGKLAQYVIEGADNEYDGVRTERIPMRPGEKMHETLLTIEEAAFASETEDFYFLRPTTTRRTTDVASAYSSDWAPEMTKEELLDLLADV